MEVLAFLVEGWGNRVGDGEKLTPMRTAKVNLMICVQGFINYSSVSLGVFRSL